MGVTTFSNEISSAISPSRMFKAMVLDRHNVLPKILPESIKSINCIEGDGGVGSIEKINWCESSHIKYMKYKMNALDAGSFYCKGTMIESDLQFDNINFIINEVKFTETEMGCVCKLTTKYHVRKGAELGMDVIKKGKDILEGLFKAVEGYLVEYPDLSA